MDPPFFKQILPGRLSPSVIRLSHIHTLIKIPLLSHFFPTFDSSIILQDVYALTLSVGVTAGALSPGEGADDAFIPLNRPEF